MPGAASAADFALDSVRSPDRPTGSRAPRKRVSATRRFAVHRNREARRVLDTDSTSPGQARRGAACFVLRASCFVLRASCFVLRASCFARRAACGGARHRRARPQVPARAAVKKM
ncbi:hypothetical protein FTI75_24180 [Burkholderia pseudomallei]|nr:hypothetical protein FTI75_24180 [Burkholderia pseudomallei]